MRTNMVALNEKVGELSLLLEPGEEEFDPLAGYNPVESDGRKYILLKDFFDWYEARDACRSIPGMDLAKTDSQAQEDKVKNLSSGVVWIGASDLENEGVYLWSDGSAIEYDADYHTSNPGSEDNCISLSPRTDVWFPEQWCSFPLIGVCSTA